MFKSDTNLRMLAHLYQNLNLPPSLPAANEILKGRRQERKSKTESPNERYVHKNH
jgi:hypothetical protein